MNVHYINGYRFESYTEQEYKAKFGLTEEDRIATQKFFDSLPVNEIFSEEERLELFESIDEKIFNRI